MAPADYASAAALCKDLLPMGVDAEPLDSTASGNDAHQEHHQKDKEQNLGETCGHTRDAEETKRTGQQCNYQENQRVM